VFFSKNGDLLASCSLDRTIKIWDANTGVLIKTMTGHLNFIRHCIFSPSGKLLLTASADTTLKLWDIESGKEVRTFAEHTNWVNVCAFSQDEQFIFSVSWDSSLRAWDIKTGKIVSILDGIECFTVLGDKIATFSTAHTCSIFKITNKQQNPQN